MIGQGSPSVHRVLKSNITSETSAPDLPRRDRSPKGRLSGPDRAPAGASAGSPTKNGEPERHHTTARMARSPHGGRAHRDAAAKPPCAAKRTKAHIALAATAAPADVAGSRRARMPPGGNRRARAHEFGAAHARPTGRSAA